MVRFIAFTLALVFAAPTHVGAQTPPAPSSPRTALPPPAFDDKGVVARPETKHADTIEPAMPDTRPVRDKAARDREQAVESIRTSSDAVTRRQEGSATIEEYREKGRLRMVRIVPQNGPEPIYMDGNNNGRLDRDPRDGPVSPVYFTLYQWD